MRVALSIVAVGVFLSAMALGAEPAPERRTRLAIVGDRWQINGQTTYRGAPAEGLLLNVRMVNAVFEDRNRADFDPAANTDRFIKVLRDYLAHGVRAFTICLQGGMPGYEGALNSAFAADGSLRADYLARVERVIEACDSQGAAVILGCFYQRQDQMLRDEEAVRAAVVNVARWVRSRGFTNVALEIANEYPHGGFDHALLRSPKGNAELIRLARQQAPGLLVSTSGIGDGRLDDEASRESDFLLIHFNGVKLADIPGRIAALAHHGKPIVCNEDDKTGEEAARAAELSVRAGASWGLMLEKHNQWHPFHFDGAADDRTVYAKLKQLADPAAVVWPDKQWAGKSPADVGLKLSALDELAKLLGGRGCVLRHGYLAYSWGDVAQAGDVASAAKPVYAHCLWAAIESGKIASLDEPAVRIEPRLGELNPQLDHKDRLITWRHLATQTSCYGVSEQPGEAFDYSDPQLALFWDLLFLKVYGAAYDSVDQKVLRPLLAEPLECQDRPTLMAFGTDNRPGRLAISPRDFARFGLLYLRRGQWRDRQLISREHARQAVASPLPASLPRTAGKSAAMLPGQRSIGGGNNQTDHFGSYSFLWWTNGIDRQGKRHWPDGPQDAFAALGHDGERGLVVVPSLDLVASWNDAVAGRSAEAVKLLGAAAQ